MNKTRLGFLLLAGISTLFAVGIRYIFGTEKTGDILLWLFVLTIISVIIAIAKDK